MQTHERIDDARSARSRRRQKAIGVAAHIMFMAVGVIALAPSLLPLIGLVPLIVHGDSMAPTLHEGDVVLTRSIAASAVESGHVVTFPDPQGKAKPITHRVLQRTQSGSSIIFVTKGDANPGVERWSTSSDGRLGRLTLSLPKLGHIAGLLSRPPAKVAFIFPLAVVLWRSGGSRRMN